jgi:hypothetical protein
MKRSVSLFAPIALLLLGAAQSHASFIPWTYNWDRSPVSVLSDNGNGSVSFTNEPANAAVGSTDTVATNLKANSLAAASSPDTISGSNGNYTLKLTLTDTASGQSALFTFTGKLSGTFSANSANITNQFTGTLTQSIVLGNNTYTVSIGSYSPPGPPDSSNFGSISAHVDVSSASIQGAPEPASLLLAGLGVSMAGFSSWRKRRAARV